MKAIEAVATGQKRWAERIGRQSQSNLSVSAFCRDHGVSDQSFYSWRKRLPGSGPVRFALGEASAPVTSETQSVELILASGDRLRIAPGANAATLRTLRSVLRERA